MNLKKIYLLGYGPLHAHTKLMIEYPPRGYQFVLQKGNKKIGLVKYLKKISLFRFLYRKTIKNSSASLKLNDYLSSDIPEDVDLIFPSRARQFNRPFIIEILDNPVCLTGYNYKIFMERKKEIESILLSKYCKKILVVNETSEKLMRKYFSREVIKKVVLVRAAVAKHEKNRSMDRDFVQLLFLGSLANPEDFYTKGGIEALESFKQISLERHKVRLVIRCKVPEEVKKKYGDTKNLQIIEGELDSSEFDKLIRNTDICLCPAHHYALMSTLEFMSYGLPIIALDTYAVKDYLSKECAILIKPSKHIEGYKSEEYPNNIRSDEFISSVNKLDKRVIEDICRALITLIDDDSLRIKLGRNAKKIADSKFSIGRRNNKLKKIFDQALVS